MVEHNFGYPKSAKPTRKYREIISTKYFVKLISRKFGNKIWRKRPETPSSITKVEPYFQICFSGITVIPLKKLRFWTCTIQCVKLFPEWPVALSENLVLLLLHFLFLYFHFISFLITNIFDELDFVYKKMYKPKGTCKYLFFLYFF